MRLRPLAPHLVEPSDERVLAPGTGILLVGSASLLVWGLVVWIAAHV